MGLGIGFRGSSSTYDRPSCTCKPCNCKQESFSQKRVWNGNPNPKRFCIEQHQQVGDLTILMVLYPDCKNHEGRKILVYKGTDIDGLELQGKKVGLDPHFSENPHYHSPIARFCPTDEGWMMAVTFAAALRINKNGLTGEK